jgi:hypothetical protein
MHWRRTVAAINAADFSMEDAAASQQLTAAIIASFGWRAATATISATLEV